MKDSGKYLCMRSSSHSQQGCISIFSIQNFLPLDARISKLIIHLSLQKHWPCNLPILNSSSIIFLISRNSTYFSLTFFFLFLSSSPSNSFCQFMAFMVTWPSRENWLETWKPPNTLVLNNALWFGLWSYKNINIL